MGSPAAILKTVLVLRIFTLLALAASVVFMILNNFTDIDGSKTRFTDLIAYRYVVVCGAIGFVYTVIQIPFAIYDVAREKRWIRNGFLPQFDFYGDKMIAFLLASGVGFGFGVTFEFKKAFGDFFSDQANQFLNKGLISTGLLLLGFLFMALLSIFSSIRRSTSSSSSIKKSFFG